MIMQKIIKFLSILLTTTLVITNSACKLNGNDNLDLLLAFLIVSDATATGTPDGTAPGEVSALVASSANGQIVLSWTDPTDGDFDHVEITWSPGGATVQTIASGVQSYTATGLTNGTLYTFTVKTVDSTGNVSTGTIITYTPRPVAEQSSYTADAVTFNMRYVPGKIFLTGTDNSGTGTVNAGYWMAETEVTYELWSKVYIWASGDSNMNGVIDGVEVAGDYNISHPGVMGDGTGDTIQHPVTTVSWRDVMVWTNALTEWYNVQTGSTYEPVYYSDSSYINPIRTSTDTATVNTTPGTQDAPYIKLSAKGFRLPTSNEWELAARYISDSNNDGSIIDSGEYYPGDFSSGADAKFDITTGASDYDGDSDVEYTADVSIYSVNSGFSTAVVKSMSPNALGIYDMSGNVAELNFDWNIFGTVRVSRGGTCAQTADKMQIGLVNSTNPYTGYNATGFRPVRTE